MDHSAPSNSSNKKRKRAAWRSGLRHQPSLHLSALLQISHALNPPHPSSQQPTLLQHLSQPPSILHYTPIPHIPQCQQHGRILTKRPSSPLCPLTHARHNLRHPLAPLNHLSSSSPIPPMQQPLVVPNSGRMAVGIHNSCATVSISSIIIVNHISASHRSWISPSPIHRTQNSPSSFPSTTFDPNRQRITQSFHTNEQSKPRGQRSRGHHHTSLKWISPATGRPGECTGSTIPPHIAPWLQSQLRSSHDQRATWSSIQLAPHGEAHKAILIRWAQSWAALHDLDWQRRPLAGVWVSQLWHRLNIYEAINAPTTP